MFLYLREPYRHAIGVVCHDNLPVVDERVLESFVLVCSITIAELYRIRSSADVVRVKYQRRVKVDKCDCRNHALGKDKVDEIIVVVQSCLVDRSSRQRERQYSGPWDRETVVLNTNGSKPFNVLLVQKVVLVCHVV